MKSNSTPLIDALNDHASYDQITRVKRLLDDGADPNQPNAFGLYPLHVAVQPEILQLLLNAGARTYVRCSHGSTPLHRAVINGHFECARRLVNAGADKACRDKHGRVARSYLRYHSKRFKHGPLPSAVLAQLRSLLG